MPFERVLGPTLVTLMAAALLAPPLAALAPPAGVGLTDAAGDDQQQPPPTSNAEIKVTDAAADVSPVPGGPAVPYNGLADSLDITEVRAYGETGEVIRFSLKVKDLKQEPNYPSVVSQGVDYWICFKLKGQAYAVWLYLVYQGAPVVSGRFVGTINGECTNTGATWARPMPALRVDVDPLNSRILFTVRRMALGQAAAGAPPGVGDTITGIYAIARDHRPTGGVRFDTAPDAGPDVATLVLAFPTANQDLQARAEVNVPFPLPCGQNPDLPTYAIEAGGKRGIPVTITNTERAARRVDFGVRTLEGPDWSPKMMPGIEIPAATDYGLGNLTVTVIVDTPDGTKHKDCATITVRAVDPQRPESVGETSINVVAAVPPSPARNTFYLHSNELATNACAGDNMWMSLDASDPLDKKQPVPFTACPGFAALSLEPTTLTFRWDVNPNYDLIVNSTATGKQAEAVVKVRSDHLPTKARFTFLIFGFRPAGVEIYGQNHVDRTVNEQPQELRVKIPIFFTREFVAEGDPSRVFEASARIALGVRYDVLPVDNNADEAKVAGKVFLLPEGSRLTLPVWDVVKRTVNDPGASGAIISIKSLSGLEAFVNPGKLRKFNFTVLNEGATNDVAVLSARVLGGVHTWGAEVAPATPVPLAAGESKPFEVGVSPGADVKESESVLVEVAAVSQSDPTAKAQSTLKVVATLGQELQGDELKKNVDVGKKGGLPSVPALAALGAALAAGAALRRRRAL